MTAVLRLFQQDAPDVALDSRSLVDGEVVVGRDEGADWRIADPSRTLSRRHCVFAVKDGAVTVRDDSANGLFLLGGERLPPKTPIPVHFGGTVVLGDFLIRVETGRPQRRAAGALTSAEAIPGLPDETPAGRLLDAFCSGAQIDSSVLSAEDPTEVMRRLGAVYREMVQGLGRLVNERARAKAAYGLEWTSIQALDNNPFRWAPPPKVAVELLQARQEGFLSSDAAVRASFEDVGDHQLRLAAGSQGAIEALLAELAPEAIVEALDGGGSLFMKKKFEALWAEYGKAHAKARKALGGKIGGSAFREAYAEDPSDAPGEPP